jgi:phosphatidylinositol alpha-mannosyltransferase
MRIGIVSQSYYPRYGGVTEHVHHLGVELRRRGHDVVIITSRFREGDDSSGALHVERVGHNLLVPFNRAWVDLTVGFKLRRELRAVLQEYDFDLLHTHVPVAPTLPVMAVQAATCPQVGTFHTTSGRSFLQDTFHGYLNRTVVAKLDGKIAVSRTARETALLYYPGDYVVIPNGVDVERFHPTVEPLHTWRDPQKVNVLFVGRLDPRKGLQYLLAAMPEVVERTGGRARLLVVGDGYLRPRYEAAVPTSVRHAVHFVGRVPAEELPRWYATGDIFVSPASSHESFGIVLAEAMAAGRAVVGSDLPGYRSVLNPGENGVVFPPGDSHALALTIAALVNDPDRRRALAERGRASALEFAWPRVTDRIEEVYRQAMGRKALAHTAA